MEDEINKTLAEFHDKMTNATDKKIYHALSFFFNHFIDRLDTHANIVKETREEFIKSLVDLNLAGINQSGFEVKMGRFFGLLEGFQISVFDIISGESLDKLLQDIIKHL